MSGFFNEYSQFLKTSTTGSSINRLQNRYQVLIEGNKELINGKRILDLTSHDGRFSFGAIKNGASFVKGIEINPKFVEDANKNMEKYEIPKEKYDFVCGDIFEEMSKLKPNEFDVVFCFGIFYHITNHLGLLSEIARLKPDYLLLDTQVIKSNAPTIRLRRTTRSKWWFRDSSNETGQVIRGKPSRSAVELMLKHTGFDFSYLDWNSFGITNWDKIKDYKNGMRVSLVCKNLIK